MADDIGAVFTQSGSPVRGAADYQKVFDSRWKFMEIEFEVELSVTLPAINPIDFSVRYYDKVLAFKHNLGFIPAFETNFVDQKYNYDYLSMASIFANTTHIFFRRLVSTDGAEEQIIPLKLRIYNVAILEEYVALKGIPQGTSSPRSTIGVKFLDGNTAGVDIGDDSPVGFSVDTTKKILSIHRHGTANINTDSLYRCGVSAINTTTDVFTLASALYTYGDLADYSWAQVTGTPVYYRPSMVKNPSTGYYEDGTPPAGMTSGQMYYTVYVAPGEIKLATSYNNAVSGVTIDVTSTGDLPGEFSKGSILGNHSNAIYHDVGYPPTYLLAKIDRDESNFYRSNPELYIGPILDHVLALTTADGQYLYFKGIQSMFIGIYGYIILKDPAEIAR